MVAGTFILGRLLASRNVGTVAAVIVALLPRTNYMGADARPYAITTAVAVWCSVLLIVLVRHPFATSVTRRLAWLGYALSVIVGIYVFLYLGLLLVVHGVFLLTDRSYQRHRRAWAKAAGLAIVASLPILALGFAQRAQIAFLAHRGAATARHVFVTQWFGKPLLAVLAWAVIAVALGGAVLIWRRTRTASPVLTLGLLWVALPTTALLALNVLTPAYNFRYASFCVPGVALVLAAGIWMLRTKIVAAVLVVLLLACEIPIDVAQRGAFAKDGGSDLAQAAAVIGREAQPGDGIIFDGTTANRQRPRLAEHLYPADFVGLQDVALKTPYLNRSMLWDTTYPTSEITSRLALIHRVWVVELRGSPDNVQGTDIAALEADGYTLESTFRLHRTIIYSLARN
jgi:mannosyltransferase